VDHLFNIVLATKGLKLNVDLERQVVEVPGAEVYKFDVDDSRKQSLLNGWDEIGRTLRHNDKIKTYEASRAAREPWLFS
jgi:3-isopropylmalate/(R)-2-methylmalate dehydratase small subunit